MSKVNFPSVENYYLVRVKNKKTDPVEHVRCQTCWGREETPSMENLKRIHVFDPETLVRLFLKERSGLLLTLYL